MRILLHIAFCLLSHMAIAQHAPLYFRNLNEGNGLSHNKVNCIIQDKRGFTWMGTEDGLNRYDGFRFIIYKNIPGDSASVSGNIITDLFEDKEGMIWIATADGGLSRFDYRQSPAKQFKQFRHNPDDASSIPANFINAITEDQYGFLWLATSGSGILRFNKRTNAFDEPVRQRSRTILSIVTDKSGWMWAGRQGGGMIRFNPRTFILNEDLRYANVYAKLPHMTVAALFADSRENLWLGSWDKVLYTKNIADGTETVYKKENKPYSFPGDDATSFAEDSKKNIWIGGKNGGLYVYNPSSGLFYHYKNDPAKEGTIAANQVNCIYADTSGMVWIGTNNGISIHDPSQQQFTQHFFDAATKVPVQVYDIKKDDTNGLIIGTNNGLYQMSRLGKVLHVPLRFGGEDLQVTSFLPDEGRGVFIGTQLSLFYLDKNRMQPFKLPNTEKDIVMNRIIESRVVSMVRDSLNGRPVLFVLPYGHYLAYYDFTDKKWVSRLDTTQKIVSSLNLKDNLLRKIFRSKDGTIWLATAKSGLGELTKTGRQHFIYHTNIPGDKKSLGNNNVFDICEDGTGNLWISTYGGGLYHYRRKENIFEHIDGSHNLAEGLHHDAKGNIWMIANGNIHRYDPSKKTYTSFQLPDLEKSGGVRGHIFPGLNGKLIVAGSNYIIVFHPDAIREYNSQPPVHFTDFSIFNTSHNGLLYDKEIVLKHNQNFFSVEFSAPGYQAGYPVQYAHKLEGIDDKWVDDGTRNIINYTNLDGGRYTLHVRATVKPGVWSNEMATLNIRIIPPFWKTIWFYGLMAVVAALVIYGIYLYRINEIIRRQDIRNKIAQDLHDNVGSTLSSISVYSQVAKIYRQQEKAEQLQQTLEKISSTSSEMISEMNDIVWAINPRNDNMDTILQRMESFARPLLVAKNIQLRFEYEQAIRLVNLDMTKRKNLYLIFKEAVNNALKYSDASHLSIQLSKDHHQFLMKIQDNGKGFDIAGGKNTSSLSGNGLQNMRLRAREMKGILELESGPDRGFTLLLRFPIP
jgi:ligand-binding sensor domain-containing protein/two-component sensor histidine kinase